jgi:hypothetical protein
VLRSTSLRWVNRFNSVTLELAGVLLFATASRPVWGSPSPLSNHNLGVKWPGAWRYLSVQLVPKLRVFRASEPVSVSVWDALFWGLPDGPRFDMLQCYKIIHGLLEHRWVRVWYPCCGVAVIVLFNDAVLTSDSIVFFSQSYVFKTRYQLNFLFFCMASELSLSLKKGRRWIDSIKLQVWYYSSCIVRVTKW